MKSGATTGPFEAAYMVNGLGGTSRHQADLPRLQFMKVCDKLTAEIVSLEGYRPETNMEHRLLTAFDTFPKSDMYKDLKLVEEGPRLIFRGSTAAA